MGLLSRMRGVTPQKKPTDDILLVRADRRLLLRLFLHDHLIRLVRGNRSAILGRRHRLQRRRQLHHPLLQG